MSEHAESGHSPRGVFVSPPEQDDATRTTNNESVPKTTGTEWASTAEAAQMMGVGTRTLYKLIDAGEIPAYQFGRVFRLRRADIAAYIEAHRVQPGTLSHLYTAPVDLEPANA